MGSPASITATTGSASASAPVATVTPGTETTVPADPVTTRTTSATSPTVTEGPAATTAADQASPGSTPHPGPTTVEHRSGPDGFSFDVAGIEDALRLRIEPTSWRPGCPVSLDELRYLRLSHRGFDGTDTSGELIVHRDHVEAMFAVFSTLWTARFPIRSMRLIDDFGGDDFSSVEADNTSAFNCRYVAGTSRWSNHATGGAIDINPLENPYVSDGATTHSASVPFLSRQAGTGVILEGGAVVTDGVRCGRVGLGWPLG